MKQKKIAFRILLSLSFLFFSFGCRSTQVVISKSSKIFENQDHAGLSLRGMGVKNIFMVKILTAGLYLPSEIASENALDVKVPKQIAVLFYAKFSSKDFNNFTIGHMKSNLTKEEFNSLKDQIVDMGKLFPSIQPGDTMILSYKPGDGTSFIHNGQNKGTIKGELFSKGIFSTWIGPKPIDDVMKKKILGMSR